MKIFCVITTKNRFEYLKKNLASIHEQTYKPDKIIVSSYSDDDNYKTEKKFIENNQDNTLILKDEY